MTTVRVLGLSDVPVDEVVLFFDCARVTRRWSTDSKSQLKPGLHTICLRGIAGGLDEESLRVEISGAATVRHAGFEKPLPDERASVELAERTQQLDEARASEWELNQVISRLQRQRLVWDQYVENLAKGDAPFDESANSNLPRFLKNYDAECRKIEKDLEKLQSKRKEFTKTIAEDLHEIERLSVVRNCVVTLDVESLTAVALTFTYTVRDAKWLPEYDIKVFTEHSRMQATCNAMVTQNTGEEWKEINLSLATVSPATAVPDEGAPSFRASEWNGTKLFCIIPSLDGKCLEMRESDSDRALWYKLTLSSPETGSLDVTECPKKESAYYCPVTVAVPYRLSVADGTKQTVKAWENTMEVSVVHFCQPRKSTNAEVVVSGMNLSPSTLLPVDANFFLDGVFMGKRPMQATAPSMPFEFSMGSDLDVRLTVLPPEKRPSSSQTNLTSEVYKHFFEIHNDKHSSVNAVAVWPYSGEHKVPEEGNGVEIPITEAADACKIVKQGAFDASLSQIEWAVQVAPHSAQALGLFLRTPVRPMFPDFARTSQSTDKDCENGDSSSLQETPLRKRKVFDLFHKAGRK